MRKGRLEWEGEPAGYLPREGTRRFEGKVVWVDDDSGPFELLFEPGPRIENNIAWRAGVPYPQNDKLISIGCDPIDHDTAKMTGHLSSGVAWCYMRRNMLDPERSNTFFLKYVDRPPKVETFYESVIKMCYYCGATVLYESNRDKIRMYFELRGFGSFLWYAPGRKDPGLPTSTRSKQDLAEVGISFVEEFSSKLFFPDLIQDLLKFDITETRKYDLAMAALWTLFKDLYMMYVKKYEDTTVKDQSIRYYRKKRDIRRRI